MVLGVPALAAVLALGACGNGDGEAEGASASTRPAGGAALSGDAPVAIANFEFEPQKVVVKPGTKVTWTNDDSAIHSVKDTSPLATPVSSEMAQGETFSITYDSPGSYPYICGVHQYMTGTVDVVA